MSASLISEDNLCGKTLLHMSASGSSIIAELLRLKDNIPEVFSDSDESQEKKYVPVLIDFAYLKRGEEFERKLNASTGMLDLDQEFFDNYQPILMRFYTLFESIVKYLSDYLDFLDKLQSGIFIQYTTDIVLQDVDGKQLMCECLYLYGAMLLLLERHMPGPMREKIVIAVMRHQGEMSLEHHEDVCKLIRSTGYDPNSTDKHPKNYPENFFSRFAIPSNIVRLLVQTLQSDDIYRVARSFPSPEHRSVRLANQAGMLYVILYFAPELLHKSDTAMRETVDRHFGENWIITIYMGHVIDLSHEWARYKAAKKALDNILTLSNITSISRQNLTWFQEAKLELAQFLTEGILTPEFLLRNTEALLQCMRKSNVALRWRLLHRRAWQPKFAELIRSQISPNAVMDLLLTSAQLEYQVKNMFGDLLDQRQAKWDECKGKVMERLTELSEYFTGEKALTRVKRDERMMQWFAGLAKEVEAMNEGEEHSTVMGRKIQKTITALEEVEQFEQIDTDEQLKAFLGDTRELLRQLVRVVNIKHADLSKMEVISDLSYGFEILNDYTSVLHDRVRSEPNYSVLLRAGFVKLASILDVPLTRINQVDSPDALSVAEFYSGELVDFMRRLLDVIPRSVFMILSQIVEVQTHRLKALPVKFESHYLKEYAQLDERYHLALLTNKASNFTEGVLAMEKTALGIIQVDARQVLQDGLRKELVRQVSEAMHSTLTLRTGVDLASEFERVMSQLGQQMEGFRRSIEYIQDYVDLAGLKMWQEEVSRIINYNIEQECNKYLKKKVLEHNSKYQSKVIPIPRFRSPAGPLNAGSVNFMGRVMNALMLMTSPDTTVFAPENVGWYNSDGTEVAGIKTFALLNSGLSVTGLAGLDRLLAFRIVHHLGAFLKFHKENVTGYLPLLEQIRDGLFPENSVPRHSSNLYSKSLKKLEKLMAPMLSLVLKIGQAQLLRRQMTFVLKFSCRLDANLLYQGLTTVNTAVLNDVREHYRNPAKPYPKESNPLLGQLNKLLSASGMSDPFCKIYTVTEPVESLPALLLFFVITYMQKLQFDHQFSTLVRRKQSYPLDGMPFVVGVWTLLKQFHPSYTRQLLAYLGQFVRASVQHVQQQNDGKLTALPMEATNTLLFIDHFCKVGKIPRSAISEFIPSYIFDHIQLGVA
mmetsp:Transcript_48746/g.137173  ORF Transcript_48746/g.137173 Transcript_48746/m.137173 type:complete len:1158 (+) Transcript_48746:260-3733(+)